MTKDRFLNYRQDIPRMIANEGFFSLYKGFWATFWRDMPSWASYFYFYAAFKELFSKINTKGT